MKPGVLIREGDTVGLATNTLEDSKRTNPTGRKLTILKPEVFSREFDKVSDPKLLRDIISVIIIGHTFLCLDKAAI